MASKVELFVIFEMLQALQADKINRFYLREAVLNFPLRGNKPKLLIMIYLVC